MAEKRAVVLDEPRMKSAEYERRDYIVNAPEGTTVNDVLSPQFWAHVAPKLSPYDRIEVRVDTGEWMLELVVLGCDRNWAQVHVLHKYDIDPVAEEMPSAKLHKVEFKGPQMKYCVIRIADNQVIFKGLSKAEAFAEMARHEAATA